MAHQTSPSRSHFLRMIPCASILVFIMCAVAFTFSGLKATAQELSPKTGASPISDASPRIVERIDEDSLITLKGNTRPEACAANDRGPVSPSLEMGDLTLVLRRGPAQQAAFEAFLQSQQDPVSPNFHHWLESKEIGERFGPAQSDIDSITRWLSSHGLAVSSVSKDRLSISFSGTAAQVESTFHTEIHNLQVKTRPVAGQSDGQPAGQSTSQPNFENHIANMSDPKIPAALVPVVVGPMALHNFFAHPLHHLGPSLRRDSSGKWVKATPAPATSIKMPPSIENRAHAPAKAASPRPNFGVTDSSGNQYELLVPYDLATIYNFNPLWSASTPIDGTGQTIAIAGTSGIVLNDVNTFRSATGLTQYNSSSTAPTFTYKYTNTDPGTTSAALVDDRLENTVDVEWSGGVAKNANVILVSSTAVTASTDALFLSEQYIVDNKVATIMNVSYGECELGMGTAGNAEYNNLWSTAQGKGIAVFVATGDSGSASCDAGEDSSTYYAAAYGLSVSGFSSTDYNVAVGGTDLNWNADQSTYWAATNNATNLSNALGYIPEIPWNDSVANTVILAQLNAQNGNSDFDAESWANAILADYQDSSIPLDEYQAYIEATGGTGGVSACTTSDGATVASCQGGNPKPSWQTGVTGISSSDKRTVPDVSFFAANGALGSIYLFCDTLLSDGSGGTTPATCDYSTGTSALAESIGGTSVASPVMAGVMALVNQKAGSSQGNPNPILYQLAAKENYSGCSAETVTASSSCVFNDIDTSNNAEVCDPAVSPNCTLESSSDVLAILSGYNAGTGYDKASGLGSLNVANFVNAYAATVAPVITLSPTSLTFSSEPLGTASSAQSITLSNTSNNALSITSIGITGTNAASFTESDDCGSSLSGSSTCTIKVTFDPTVAGSLTASLSIADNASNSPQTVALTGTGTSVVSAPAVSLSPTSLTFGSTKVGTSAATQVVTVSNIGTATLTITGVTVTGSGASSFAETNDCSSVAASATCKITVTFTPAAVGTLTASIVIADNVTGSPQTITLTGTGATTASAPAVSFSPTSLTFASTTVGTSAPTQTVTLKNTGNAALTITGVTVTGTNASSFTETNNCTSVAPSSTCQITVTFTPTVTGTLTASIAVADNATGSPQTITLTGTGTAAVTAPAVSLSPTSLTFASTTVGTSAATQTVTLKNTGNASLTVSLVTITGSGLGSFSQANTCANAVAAGTTCTLTVTFTPSVAGSITAALNIADNAVGSPQSVTLTGTGVTAVPPSFTLAAPALTVTPGTAGSETVTVTPANGYTGTVNLTCSIAAISGGVDAPTCTGGSATVSSTGGTGTLTIGSTGPSTSVVQRTTKIAELEKLRNTELKRGRKAGVELGIGAIAIGGLLLFGIPARRRSWQSILGVLVFIAGIGVLSGCGGGGSKTTNPGTTPGSYTVSVTGTDSATSTITSQTTFTLTVN